MCGGNENGRFETQQPQCCPNSFHLVWKVKYSYAVLNRLTLRSAVEGFIRLVCFHRGWDVYELQVILDHFHSFVGFPYDISAGIS